jgi:hypothetical protein
MAAGTTDRISSTLPIQATGFVGRRRELANLNTVLGNARLVTVTGAGGVGKARLAVQASERRQLRERAAATPLPRIIALALGNAGQLADGQPAGEALPRGQPVSPAPPRVER